MSVRNAISEARNVTVTFDDGTAAQLAMPIDAYKAAIEKVEVMEGRFAKLGAAGVPDLAGASVLVTGSLPFQIHVFTVTTTMASGDYEFVYVETVPDADSVS